MIRFLLGFMATVLGLSLTAYGGTSVGNFNFKTQPDFDFRMGVLKSWEWERSGLLASEVEQWRLTNRKKVQDADHVSSAEVTFIAEFPASNAAELLAEISRLHPEFNWMPLDNPFFTVGFVSNQVHLGPERTRNFEYYFSSKNKVVRIEAIRDQVKDGAAELDTMLLTIRKPSGAPRLVSVSPFKEEERTSIEVGERFCYRIEVDLFKNDFDSDSLAGFKVKGALRHWSFKDVTWVPEESYFKVCVTTNRRFGADGLLIEELNLSSSGEMTLDCTDASVEGSHQLICDSAPNKSLITYQVPQVNNPHPVQTGPHIESVKVGNSRNSILISTGSVLPLVTGEVVLGTTHSSGSDPVSQVIYSDQITGSTFEIAFEKDRLEPGINRVVKVMLTDEAGNMSVLQPNDGEATYRRYSTGKPAEATEIKVINMIGEQR